MEQVRSQTTFKEFQPSPYWISSPTSHVLFVDVPGFKMQELMVATKKPWKVIVSGARPVPGNKYSQFLQEFDAPQDSDFSQISARFDNGVLTIILPRKVTEKTEEPIQKDQSEGNHDQYLYKNKKEEWERNGRSEDHGVHKQKEEKEKNGNKGHDLGNDLHKEKEEMERKNRTDHDLHKKGEMEKYSKQETGHNKDPDFKKEKEEGERSPMTEGGDLGRDDLQKEKNGKGGKEKNGKLAPEGYDQGPDFQKEKDERERRPRTEGRDHGQYLQKEKKVKEEGEKNDKLELEGHDQGPDFQKEKDERGRRPRTEGRDHGQDDLQKKKKARNVSIEGKEHIVQDVHEEKEEFMRFIKIEGRDQGPDFQKEKEMREMSLITEIGDHGHNDLQKEKNGKEEGEKNDKLELGHDQGPDFQKEKDGRERRPRTEGRDHGQDDLQKEKKPRNVSIEGRDPVHDPRKERKDSSGMITGSTQVDVEDKRVKENKRKWADRRNELETPAKGAMKTISKKKASIAMALIAVSIGFCWSHRLLSGRKSEST